MFSLLVAKILEVCKVDDPKVSISAWNNHEAEKSGLEITFKSCTFSMMRKSNVHLSQTYESNEMQNYVCHPFDSFRKIFDSS